jgi:putative ABC transport system permease protein
MRRFLLRLFNVLRRQRADEELDREVASHLALLADEHVRRGRTPNEARLAARRAMGSVALAKDLHRDARAFAWLDDLRQDLRFTMRLLRRDPAFMTIAVATLALGIGANTAIFSAVNSVLLRPLPYEGSESLVRIAEHLAPTQTGAPLAPRVLITGPELEALQSMRTLSDVGRYGGRPFSMTLNLPEGGVRLTGEQVSTAVFPMLGARPILGRVFEDHEMTPGSDAVVILSHSAWLRYFAARPDILGRVLSLDGKGYTVISVMPPGFAFPDPQSAFWIPFTRSAPASPQDTGVSIARIADGRGREEAVAEVSAILSRLRGSRQDARPLGRSRFDVFRVRDELVAPVRAALVVLAVAVGIVLLIACANVAGLLLSRTAVRQKEIAIRVAIGASRARLVRQSLTESVTLALAGGTAGTGLAVGLVALLRALGSSLPRRDLYTGTGIGIPRLEEVGIDISTLIFTVFVSLATGVLFGLAPALRQSRAGSAQILQQGTGRHRARTMLVAAELALGLMLLVGGGLLVRSFIKLSNVDPGYDPTNVVWFQAFLPRERAASQVTAFAEGMVERLGAVPGIAAAGYAPQIPTGNLLRETSLRTRPEPPSRPPEVRTDARVVSQSFLTALGVRVVAGRGFDARDGAGQPRVMLINETLARTGEFDGDPIGKRFYTIGEEPWEIVGIVEDIHQFGLDREPGRQVFIDFRQSPSPGRNGLFIAVRTDRMPGELASSVRDIARDLDPLVTVDSVATMEQLLSNAISRPRFYTVLLAVFAVAAVVLAVIGLYALMSYTVAQRTREIGIRMALGAQRREVMKLVLSDSLVTTSVGVALGLTGAAGLTRYLEGMLFALTPLDPVTFFAVALLFAAVAGVASYVPARRATRVDPLVALRAE